MADSACKDLAHMLAQQAHTILAWVRSEGYSPTGGLGHELAAWALNRRRTEQGTESQGLSLQMVYVLIHF